MGYLDPQVGYIITPGTDDRELYIMQCAAIHWNASWEIGLSALLAYLCLHFILITHARSSYWSSSSKSYHVTHRRTEPHHSV